MNVTAITPPFALQLIRMVCNAAMLISDYSHDSEHARAELRFDSRSENVELLHTLISSLPYVDRAIIMMWLDKCPYDEIAEVTGLSKNNVAVKIHRLKNRMADSVRNNITKP